MSTFSQKHGFSGGPAEIVYRTALPIELRRPIVDILRRYFPEAALLQIQKQVHDPYGIAPPLNPTAPLEIHRDESDASFHFRRFMLNCPWFQVYDIIEEVLGQLQFYETELLTDPEEEARNGPLQRDINEYFKYAGIGWQLVDGEVVARGDDAFEATTKTAVSVLEEETLPTAAGHLRFAVGAMSLRPTANTCGAVAHSTSAVECVLGEITGKAMTLGKYLDKYPQLFHPALKKALDGIYGYASDEGARHGKEGTEPSTEEAQFVIATCAAVCTLLTKKHPK